MNIADILSARKLFPERFGARNICSSRLSKCNSLYRKTLFGHHGCVNTLSFSPDERLLASSGDDRRILVWDAAKCINERQPSYHMQMCSKHDSNVFTTCFNSDASLLMSGGNDERILSHDIHSNKLLADFTFSGTEILFIDCHPTNPNVSIAGASCGKLMSVDQRMPHQTAGSSGQQPHRTAVIRDDCIYSSFRCVKFVPCDGNYIVAANSISGLSLRDLRKSKDQVVLHYTQNKQHQQDSLASLTTDNGDMMHCTLDSSGTQLLALSGRQSTLYLYDIDKPEEPKATFASRCLFKSTTTIKVCSFFGPSDEYVVCGSNDFNIYMWKVPKQGGFKHVRIPHMQLRGHRSIVNQVVGSKRFNLLASSGTEKIIKIWSPFHINHGMGSIDKEVGVTREHRYSYDDYLNFILTEGPIDHDYEFGTTEEDPRVLALFDLDHLGGSGDNDDASSGNEDGNAFEDEPRDGFRRFSRYTYDDGEQNLANPEAIDFCERYLNALERSSQELTSGTVRSGNVQRANNSGNILTKNSRDDGWSESSEDLYTFDWPEDSSGSISGDETNRDVSTGDADGGPRTKQPKASKSASSVFNLSTANVDNVTENATNESTSNLDESVSSFDSNDEPTDYNSSAVRLKNADRGRKNRKRKSSQTSPEQAKEFKDG